MKKTFKLISLLMTAVLAAQLFAVLPAAADGALPDKWIRESFESSDISHITAVNSTLSRSAMRTYGGSAGALGVSVTKNAGAPSFEMTQKKGVTYEISCMIMMKETPLIDRVQFVFQAPSADNPEKKAYTTVSVNDAGLKAGRWTRVSARYVCDGMGKLVGVTNRVPVTEDGTLDIRIGDGNIASTSPNGSTVDYYLDDLVVMPVMRADDGNIVSDGDFESAGALTSWKISSSAKVSVENDADGSYAKVGGSWNMSNLSQQVPVEFNTDYTVSFRLKTDDEQTLNSQVQLIFDRHGSKTDDTIKSYEYLRDENNMTIGSQWSEYKINYRYDYGGSGEGYPTMYIRIGSGEPEKVEYCIDDIKITENGAGAAQPMTLTLAGTAAAGETIRADMDYSGDEDVVCYAAAVRRKSGTESAIVYTEETSEPYFEYTVTENDKNSYLEFSAYAVTADGAPVSFASAQTGRTAGEASVVTLFENAVWTENDKTLSASVKAEAGAEPTEAFAALAVYNGDGSLAGVKLKNIDIQSGEKAEYRLEAEADGASAAVLVFDRHTMEPLAEPQRIEKLSGAQLVYVDPDAGNDGGAGTYDEPLMTIGAAKEKAAALAPEGDVYVFLKGGTHRITEPAAFTPSDNAGDHKIVFTSYEGRAEISGGVKAEGWELFDSEKNIYRSYVGTGIDFRQLYVNGIRGTRARSEAGLTDAVHTAAGYVCDNPELAEFAHPEELEMVYYVKWSNPRCAVESVSESGGETVIKMNPTGWNKIQNKGQSSVTEDYLPAYYENAYELLDEEGEWYLDRHEGYLYYIPRFFEDMETADVEMPAAEKLLTIRGTADRNVKNIEFRDIDFKYSTWLRPTEQGYLADTQNNYQNGVAGSLPDAAVELSNVNGIAFYGCEFSKIGITAMKLTEGVKNCVIDGNEFYDISGSAVSLGVPSGDYDIYINPKDEKYVVRNNAVTDNYIHTTGVDYKSAAALSAAFPKDTVIANNEIFDSPYSGMSLGHGWATYEDSGTATENLVVEKNFIHNVLNDKVYDGGAIYTIGNTSGNGYNYVRGNYIKDVRNFYGALYPDEGSQYWEFSSNVMDLSAYPLLYGAGGGSGTPTKWLHLWTDSIKNNRFLNNYSTTSNSRNDGINNEVQEPAVCDASSWPPEARDIIDESGISDETAKKHNSGLKDIEAMTEYTLSAGETAPLVITALTGKGELYDYEYSDIYIKNADPDIIEVTDDFNIKAVGSGTAELCFAVAEKGILRSFAMTVNVK